MNIFGKLLQWLPALFQAAQTIQNTINAPGQDKKTKAIEMVTTGLQTVNQIDPSVLAHPAFQDALGKVNDAIVYAAQVGHAVQNNVPLPTLPPTIGSAQ